MAASNRAAMAMPIKAQEATNECRRNFVLSGGGTESTESLEAYEQQQGQASQEYDCKNCEKKPHHQ